MAVRGRDVVGRCFLSRLVVVLTGLAAAVPDEEASDEEDCGAANGYAGDCAYGEGFVRRRACWGRCRCFGRD